MNVESTYMVFVEGRQAPSVEHTTGEEARIEAERLSTLSGNDKLRIYVVSVVDVLEPVKNHRWRSGHLTKEG